MQRTEARDSLESHLSREPEGPHMPSSDTWPPTLGKDSDSDSVGRMGLGWGQESDPVTAGAPLPKILAQAGGDRNLMAFDTS